MPKTVPEAGPEHGSLSYVPDPLYTVSMFTTKVLHTQFAPNCNLLFIDLLITLLSALRWEFYTLRFTRRRVHLSWCTKFSKGSEHGWGDG